MNKETNRVHETRDILWLKRMFYTSPVAEIAANDEANEDRESESEEEENEESEESDDDDEDEN